MDPSPSQKMDDYVKKMDYVKLDVSDEEYRRFIHSTKIWLEDEPKNETLKRLTCFSKWLFILLTFVTVMWIFYSIVLPSIAYIVVKYGVFNRAASGDVGSNNSSFTIINSASTFDFQNVTSTQLPGFSRH